MTKLSLPFPALPPTPKSPQNYICPAGFTDLEKQIPDEEGFFIPSTPGGPLHEGAGAVAAATRI